MAIEACNAGCEARDVVSEQPEAPSDEALVAAMNAGDTAAFEVLYLRHRDWVAGLAFRLTGDHALALDVLQETFLYFLGKFPGFTLTARLHTFLYPVVRNLCLTARRRLRRWDENSASILEALILPSELPEGWQAADWAAALSGLSEDHREVLILRFEEDLSLAEISDAQGVPLGTVKSRLHHALAALRRDPKIRNLLGE